MKIVIAWLPIVSLPLAIVLFTYDALERWQFMWLFAWTIFIGSKWLTLWQTDSDASLARHLAYLLAWPGLDAHAFLETPCKRQPAMWEWTFAIAKMCIGVTLIVLAAPWLMHDRDLLRGWIAMVGIVFTLHFGLFHLLSLAWQTIGVTAKPLMNWPVLSTSVSEFWGQRWNTAFRDLTHRFLFRPLTTRFGAKAALAIGFLFSGIVHDLVISVPAGAGYGGPTAFFVIQAAAIFFERSPMGRRLGLGRGVRGWLFTMVVLVAPVALLFHRPFVENVVLPFVEWLTSTWFGR